MGGDNGSDASLQGWSKGYVEFIWDAHERMLTPWASANGLTWRAGNKLDTSAWNSYLKSYDADPAGDHDGCWVTVSNFQEGPATLLLQGIVECSGLCSQTSTDEGYGSWTSSDSLSWTPATLPYFNYGIGISGGSGGFIGVDSSTSQTTAWLSADGQTWRRSGLPAEAKAAGSSVNNPVSIAGGFVLPGVVMIKKGHQESGGGCSSGSNQSLLQGALWWSPDGTTWTRDSLSGASQSYDGVNISAFRVDDHTVVADLTTSNAELSSKDTIEWASRDGKTWTRLTGTPVTYNGAAVGSVVGRDRGLVLGSSIYPDDPNRYWPSFFCFNGGLSLVKLQQGGSLPYVDGTTSQMALGPTGLLVTEDGSRFWLGMPTGG
jgi:hypothetical protein